MLVNFCNCFTPRLSRELEVLRGDNRWTGVLFGETKLLQLVRSEGRLSAELRRSGEHHDATGTRVYHGRTLTGELHVVGYI